MIHWDKLIWNRLSISKHRVIGWLMINERLRTSYILVRIGVMDSNHCMLCENGLESHNHLFFSMCILCSVPENSEELVEFIFYSSELSKADSLHTKK